MPGQKTPAPAAPAARADRAKQDQALQTVLECFAYLRGRWSDEGAYEDFDEYRAALKKTIESAFPGPTAIISFTKRPFEARWVADEAVWYARAAGRYVEAGKGFPPRAKKGGAR